MAGKIDRFTQPARKVLQLANDEAERLQHAYIGTEHVLIGLVREEDGLGGQVLRGEGVTVDRVNELVTRVAPAGTALTSSHRRDLTPRTKQVLEYAVEEARRLNHNHIGTEHLLLGLIRQGDGPTIDALRQLGLSSDRIRRDVMQSLTTEDERKTRPTAEEAPLAQPVTGNVRYVYAILASDAEDMIDELARYAEFLLWKASRKDKPK
jgi:ATP-dependent Clp protease ATP-binding subunit ClpC